MVTIEELKNQLPPRQKKLVTQSTVDVLNSLEGEEGKEFADHFKQNFITMSTVMNSGVYNLDDYINAVKFVSYKLIEHSDIDAYMFTFPDRYRRLMEKHPDLSEDQVRSQKISPFVTAYKKNDIVVKVMDISLVPSRILNAPLFQEALNVQANLMYNSGSDVVRQAAADSILKYTENKEAQKIELDIGITGQDEIGALRDEMRSLAAQQRQGIEVGTITSTEVAERKVIVEAIDAEIEE